MDIDGAVDSNEGQLQGIQEDEPQGIHCIQLIIL
jgi:hypothetical protein